MKARRAIVIGLSVIGTLVLLAVGLGLYTSRAPTQFREEDWRPWVDQFETLAPQYLEPFCADTRLVAAGRLPRKHGTARNAGAFLNARLVWDTADAGVFGPSASVGPDDAGVVRVAMMNDWAVEIVDGDCAGIDTSWLHQLAEFDHWSLLAPGSPNDESPLTQGWSAPDIAMPKSDRLLSSAKLHMACAMRDGGFVDAAKDVEQLARLAFSTESPFPSYSGAGLMRLQARGIAVAKERGLSVGDLQPVPEDEIEAYRRAMKGIVAFSSAAVDDNTFLRMLDCAKAAGLDCAALTEGAMFWNTIQLGPVPWASRARLRAAMIGRGAEGCRLEFARYRNARPMMHEGDTRLNDQTVGLILAGTVQPNALTKTWAKDGGAPTDAGR